MREIDEDEGQRLLRIIRRGTGSVVTWRRAQMVLLSAEGLDVARIAEVSFTSADRVRDVVHNFNADGFESPLPEVPGRPAEDLDIEKVTGRPPITFQDFARRKAHAWTLQAAM